MCRIVGDCHVSTLLVFLLRRNMMVVDALLKHVPLPLGVGCGRLWKLVKLSAMAAVVAIPRNKKKLKKKKIAFYPVGISGAL